MGGVSFRACCCYYSILEQNAHTEVTTQSGLKLKMCLIQVLLELHCIGFDIIHNTCVETS